VAEHVLSMYMAALGLIPSIQKQEKKEEK
jgi:hypothetical protein